MLGDFASNINAALTPHRLAITTDRFYRCPDFHPALNDNRIVLIVATYLNNNFDLIHDAHNQQPINRR